jgi:uncharacterized membrane protein
LIYLYNLIRKIKLIEVEKMNNDKKVMRLVYTALMAAIVAVVTMAIPLPTPAGGIYNIGDSMVMLSAILLGPIPGALAGGIGSFLADMLLGYTQWAPWTLVIKAFEGLIIGLIVHKVYFKSNSKRFIIMFIPAAILAVIIITGGYYIAYGFISGSFAAASIEVPGNIAQGTISAVIALILSLALKNRLVKQKGSDKFNDK